MKVASGSTINFKLTASEIFVLTLGVVVVVALEIAFLLTQRSAEDYWLGLLALTVLLAVPVFVACLKRRMDPLEPAFIVAIAYFLYLVYAPASNLLTHNEYFFDRLMTPLVPRGSCYAAVGIAGMWLGYYGRRMGKSLGFHAPRPPSGHGHAVRYAVVVAFAALLLFGAYVEMSRLSWLGLLSLGQLQQETSGAATGGGGGSAFRNYLYGTVDWFTVAFMMLLVFWRGRRRWLLPLFLCILLIYTTIGFRYRVLIFVAAPLVFFCLKERKRPGVVGMAFVGIVAVLAIGVIGYMRDAFRMNIRVNATDVSMVAAAETFTNSLNIYQPYLAIIDGIPKRHGYLLGSSFAYLAIHPIPRSIWPSKPEAPIATITKLTLGEAAADAGVAYPNIGEYYANFGVVGIVGGMWLFGVLLRALYEYLRRHDNNDWVQLLYAIALPFLVQVVSRGYFVQIAQEASFMFLPFLASMWLARRRESRLKKMGRDSRAEALVLQSTS